MGDPRMYDVPAPRPPHADVSALFAADPFMAGSMVPVPGEPSFDQLLHPGSHRDDGETR